MFRVFYLPSLHSVSLCASQIGPSQMIPRNSKICFSVSILTKKIANEFPGRVVTVKLVYEKHAKMFLAWFGCEKYKKCEIYFTGKTALFRKKFQTFYARAARSAISPNVHQFCQPKSSFFMRETAVKWISFFLEFLMLYEVYWAEFENLLKLWPPRMKCDIRREFPINFWKLWLYYVKLPEKICFGPIRMEIQKFPNLCFEIPLGTFLRHNNVLYNLKSFSHCALPHLCL